MDAPTPTMMLNVVVEILGKKGSDKLNPNIVTDETKPFLKFAHK